MQNQPKGVAKPCPCQARKAETTTSHTGVAPDTFQAPGPQASDLVTGCVIATMAIVCIWLYRRIVILSSLTDD